MKKSWPSWGWTAAVYGSWRFVLFLASWIFFNFLSIKTHSGYLAYENYQQSMPRWITVWGNFDGTVFMRIAGGGYGYAEAPFFPFLPFVLGIGNSLGMPVVATGLIVTTLASIGSLWLLRQIFDMDQKTQKSYAKVTFPVLLLSLLSFPTAFYLSAIYQDAIFLFFACAVIWSVQRGRWWLAILSGCLAMTARLNGFALLVFLAIEYAALFIKPSESAWNWRKWPDYIWRALRTFPWIRYRFVWGFFLIPLTFALFLYYLHIKLGDWHVFFDSVAAWHRNELTFPLRTLWRYVKILILSDKNTLVYGVAVLEAASTALYLGLLWRGWGKLKLSYWWWCLAHLMIPMMTGTLQGMPRYGLHLYPMFLLLSAELVAWPRWARWIVWGSFFSLQLLLLSFFVRGYFVA